MQAQIGSCSVEIRMFAAAVVSDFYSTGLLPDQASERKNFKIFLFSTARPFFPIAQIHFEYSPLFHGLAAHRLKALNALNLPLCLGKGRERGRRLRCTI